MALKLINPFKKYPVFRQREATDCAPAALLSIIKFYQASVSFYHIRKLCKTGSRGTTLYDLKKAAEILGFRATGVTGTYAQLKEQNPPFIVHINDRSKDHYMVIYVIRKQWVLAGDPARGLRIIFRNKFEDLWKSRVAMLLWPARAFKPAETNRPDRFIKAIITSEKTLILQGLFLGIVTTGSGLLIAFYIHYLIDMIIPSSEINSLQLSAVILTVLFLVGALSILFRQRIMIYFMYRAGNALNFRFQSHLYRLPKSFFEDYRIGDTLVRLNDLTRIPAAVMVIFGTLTIDILMIIAVTGGLWLINSKIALVIALIVPVNLLVVLLFMRRISHDQQNIVHHNTILQDEYIDSFRGIDDIISYNAQALFSGITMRSFKRLQLSLKNLGLHRSSLGFTVEIFRAGSTIFVLLSGALMIIQSGMMIGQVIACYYLLTNMLPALIRLGETAVSLREAAIAWKRLEEVWQIPPERVERGKACVYFDSLRLISAAYAWNNSRMLWEEVSLAVRRGALVALTGPSGSGKTTLLQILNRKYDLIRGQLFLDDQPASAYRLKDYRRRITLVPQQIHIFKASLTANILLGRPDWYLNDLMKKFLFYDWIAGFEQGLNTLLGEGYRVLSGGEKQLIGLMRALYARPELLLIDESLNSIDPETRECMIYSLKLFALSGGVLLCTHDRNIIAQTDEVYVLENGRIKQSEIPGNGRCETIYMTNAALKTGR